MLGETERVIGTHNGKFHADEVLGCFLLKQLPEFKCAVIKRSRNPDVLNQCHVVIDVGGVYDHTKKRYDHHQKQFNHTLNTLTGVQEDIKLSSAGLVWAHYGKDIIKNMIKQELSLKEVHDVYCHMYSVFIKEIDAKDNGVEVSDPPHRYRICTDLSSRISRLNGSAFSPELDEEEQFGKAYDLAGKEFSEVLEDTVNSWLPSREIVSEALDDRFSADLSGRILKIARPGVPWSAHLRALETEKKVKPGILFVVFPDSHNGWRVQAVSTDGSFEIRQPVLAGCLALRDEELVAACGIADAIFVHANGFIGGAKTCEGVLKMARMSLSDVHLVE